VDLLYTAEMTMRRLVCLGILGVSCGAAWGQFDLEESHTTASLRGIDAVGPGVAWASGSGGTVLRTEDGGYLWQTCSVPKGAEKLDFRGVQGFDAKTAYVMSSGKGPLSKVYKTTDGCATWTLVLDDTDADGFFDAIRMRNGSPDSLYVLGDPVDGKFVLLGTDDGGKRWTRVVSPGLAAAAPGIGAFAASNTSLIGDSTFATGGPGGPFVYRGDFTCTSGESFAVCLQHGVEVQHVKVPMAGETESAGIFSLGRCGDRMVAVGGEYTKPAVSAGTAATFDAHFGGWFAAKTLPSGYRSAVAYDQKSDTCLAVGPGGSDVSKDDGVHWSPLTGDTASGWNALSLPFVVGAKGKIGKLRDGVLK
jgi:photosystem II stability/assembly factor-like uncharacterized protein